MSEFLQFRAGELKSAVLERSAERDQTMSEYLRGLVEADLDAGCDSCGNCDICGGEKFDLTDTLETEPTATIYGWGRFSETSNPEVQAVIDRAKELLREGAVGVSVATDMNPDDMPLNPDDIDEETVTNAKQRNRHLAIVDTPAFNGAFLDISDDGLSVEGPLVFEGIPTGDGRAIGPVGTFLLDESLLPMPIIFDIHEGDHTGMVVGYIDRLERRDGITTGDVAPLVASVGDYPAYLFDEPQFGPMTVDAPDAQGYRRYHGSILPADVCHKGRPGCYTYKGASLDYFHSGARIPLDNGTTIRVGPMVFGGVHADGTKLDYDEALSRTDDARSVCAMGRAFHHPKGLLFSGVLMPDADVMRIQATVPSAEIWPDPQTGKMELKTALQVNQGAWKVPIAASAGHGGVMLLSATPTVVEHEPVEHFERIEELERRMTAMEDAFAPVFAAHMRDSL